MADAIYPSFLNALLDGTAPDLDTDTIKATLVNTTTDYTYSAAHDYFNDVTDYSGVTPQTFTSIAVSGGAADTSETLTFTSVAIDGSKDVNAVVVYKDTGTPSTSQLIAYYDSFTDVTPNGGNIELTVSTNLLSLS
jgi:hypothetical protein